jgi:serine/threonine-protein kinase
MIGRTIGNFQVLDLLGEGGIGAVYAGMDQLLGRPVAIKVLRPELSHDTRFVDRFRSEAASLARLNHPHITTLYSLHLEGDQLLMIIELVEGRTLENILAESGRLTPEECQALAVQATDGFAYAHRMGVVHRDIKPANLMVTADGTLKIMDFGIARIRGSQRMTRTGHIIGTLAYMAPEQVQGQEGDERSDIYSFGIVLYELLAGAPPFVADSEYRLIRAQVEEPPQRLVERLRDIDPQLEAAVMRALAKAPEQRFPTMQAFGEALGAAMSPARAKAIVASRVGPLVERLKATRQRPMPSAMGGDASGAKRAAAAAPAKIDAPGTRLAGVAAGNAAMGMGGATMEPAVAARRRLPVAAIAVAATLAIAAAGGFAFRDALFGGVPPPVAVTTPPATATPSLPTLPPSETAPAGPGTARVQTPAEGEPPAPPPAAEPAVSGPVETTARPLEPVAPAAGAPGASAQPPSGSVGALAVPAALGAAAAVPALNPVLPDEPPEVSPGQERSKKRSVSKPRSETAKKPVKRKQTTTGRSSSGWTITR